MIEQYFLYKVYLSFRILQAIVAIVFNLVILICVGRFKYLRSTANLLVGSLALTDFLHALTSLAIPLRFLPFPWFMKAKLCIFGTTGEIITVHTELVSFAILAAERWNSLLAKLNRSKKWSRVKVLTITIICWMLICMWNIGMAIFKSKHTPEGTPCTVFSYFPSYFVFVGFSVFPIATLIIAFFYMRIACVARSSTNQVMAADAATTNEQMIKNDLRITKMMAKVVGIFFALYCPFFVVAISISDTSPMWLRVLYYISILVYDVNFWINPIIYAWSDKKFRKALEDLLPRVLTNCWKTTGVASASVSPMNQVDTGANEAGTSGTRSSQMAQLDVIRRYGNKNNEPGTISVSLESSVSPGSEGPNQ